MFCTMHIPWQAATAASILPNTWGNHPAWDPFPLWEVCSGTTASLSEAGLCLKALTVIWNKRRLHSCRAKPEGAMWSQLPASTTWSTTQHHWLSKAGVWKRLERLSILLASHWLIVPLVNLLVGIQKGKAGSCIKAWTICMWKLLHLFRIQGTDLRIQT